MCLLFVATIVSGSLFFAFNALKFLKYISVFGGAFLLAVCFVDMLPDVFAQNDNVLLCSAFILIGFLLQLLLELISKGAEHGHLHTDNSKDNPHSHSHLTPIMMLVGVSIHAFFEGFALIGENGINTSLLTGVILHNIPVSVVIVGSFVQSNSSKTRAFCMLSIFAIMGVAGALIGHYSLFVMRYAHIVLSFVVGILLHVSVSTLFDNERSHQYNFIRFLIVIAAFGLVLALP
ncbi:MAG: ZIP family metal transporter [Bacteroidales bacterium]|nr:ZIP family metal transporter [Bacteroidales bacterium]